ncbi:hypothetical protein J2S58_002067 [Nakamurella flavida]|uniref:hypothetical protein n=1 Tax=Nakamurella flavida TaxID=363630 RepID=UPI00277F775F|nr:hypothetical protein [Nakamurella flavida]MDP9778444.1 hypothetical protein [Nakamurella flavida]
MTTDLDSSVRSRGDRDRARAYLREFLPPMLAYVVVMPLVTVFGGLDGTSGWRFVWALLPVVPLLWAAVAVVRHLRRVDELQHRLLLGGLAWGFAAAMGAAVILGLLRFAGVDIVFDTWLVFAAGMMGWVAAAAASARG